MLKFKQVETLLQEHLCILMFYLIVGLFKLVQSVKQISFWSNLGHKNYDNYGSEVYSWCFHTASDCPHFSTVSELENIPLTETIKMANISHSQL